MKITRMSEHLLTSADITAMRRMRASLSDCQIAYCSDQVAVMLLTGETDPEKLAAMARKQMDKVLSTHPDFSHFSDSDGHDLVLLNHGAVFIFSREGEVNGSMGDLLKLRSIGLAACAAGKVLAIITGEDVRPAVLDPADMAPEPGEEELFKDVPPEEFEAMMARCWDMLYGHPEDDDDE